MARLKNNKIQPIWLHYVGNKGRTKVFIPANGTADVSDFVKALSNDIVSGSVSVMSESDVKMMDAQRDVEGYIETDSLKK